MPLDDANWSGVEIRDLTDGARHSGNPVISASPSSRRAHIRFEHVALVAMGVLFLGHAGLCVRSYLSGRWSDHPAQIRQCRG